MQALFFTSLLIGLVVGDSGAGIGTFISDPSSEPPDDIIMVGDGGFKYLFKATDGAPFILHLDVCQIVNGSQACKSSVIYGDGSATYEQSTKDRVSNVYKIVFKTADARIFMHCFTNPISDFDKFCPKSFPNFSNQNQKQAIEAPQLITNVSFDSNILVSDSASATLRYILLPNADFEFCLVPWMPSDAKSRSIRRRFCISNFLKDEKNCTDYTIQSFPSAHGALTKPSFSGSDWLEWDLEVELDDPSSPPWFVVIIGVKNALQRFCR